MSFSSLLDILEGAPIRVLIHEGRRGYVYTSREVYIYIYIYIYICVYVCISQQGAVFYVQKQCSNLLEELPELTDDLETHVSWMSAALGESLLSMLSGAAH